MASVRRQKGSKFWIGCFRRPDGRPTNRSTRSTDRKTALRIAEGWEEVSRQRTTETKARQVISDLYRQVNGRGLASPSVACYRDQWLTRKKTEVRPRTLDQYRSVMASFVTFLGTRAGEPLHYIEVADIARWRDELAERTSAKNANNKLKVLRCFFQSAWRDGLNLDNPAAKLKILRAEPSKRRPFTADEIRALLRVATGEWRGIILTALYTGQRLADVVSLNWTHLDLEAGVVRFTTSKTGRNQVIPLAPKRSRRAIGLAVDHIGDVADQRGVQDFVDRLVVIAPTLMNALDPVDRGNRERRRRIGCGHVSSLQIGCVPV